MNKKILRLIEQRLLIGERKYGHENVTNDGRDFLKEAIEEALDCSIYLAALLVEIDNRKLINIIKEKQDGKSYKS